MKFKTNIKSFGKIFTLIFKNIFLNYRTYFYTFLLSAAVFSISFVVWFRNANQVIMPPFIIAIVTSCTFFSSAYIGIVVVDWKKRNYLTKLQMGSINKINLLISLFLINLFISFICILINIALYNIFNAVNLVTINHKVLKNLDGLIWFLYSTFTILLILFLTIVNLLLTSISKKVPLSIFFILLFLILSVGLSDAIVQPSVTSESKALIILGYFSPAKYFVWFIMLLTSYTLFDVYGITQIIPDYFYGQTSPFINIFQTLLPALAFLIVVAVVYKWVFKWGYKI
ncbi:hypothetical protein SGLAD_v1c00790 [Spiroplasma gladiatoris]|uniref:ABC transporter permease n=1 Tax=Spiroplasma gladiatoris TaxID=2143 RepID=A0A4P7AIF6_9MOLU|nr:hypothetical protein [Spiroplasma gladiatoris]QBQ07280.1 hypothetical protein SGLAD_v1c00790 [Spiroplasma gladiatoris]